MFFLQTALDIFEETYPNEGKDPLPMLKNFLQLSDDMIKGYINAKSELFLPNKRWDPVTQI